MIDFFTISQETVFEETQKRSRFISYSFKVRTNEEVKDKLHTVKTRHWDAKHHDYAYDLNLDASLSNTIYGKSETVQPPAIQLLPQIKY